MKAIHLICHSTTFGWQDLHPVAKRLGAYVSKCWIIREDDPKELVGGYLYLHETSYKAAGFASRVLSVEASFTKSGRPGYAFMVQRVMQKSQRWRGKTPSQSRHHGGIVDACFPDEREAT